MSDIKKFADKLVAARDRATAAKYPEVAKLFLETGEEGSAAAVSEEDRALLRRIFLGSINDEEYRELVDRERAGAKPPPYKPPVSNTAIGSGRAPFTRGPSPAEVARSKANLTDADLDAAISKIDDVEQGFFEGKTATPFNEAERKAFVERYKSNAFDSNADGKTSFKEVIAALRSEQQGVGYGIPVEPMSKRRVTPEEKVDDTPAEEFDLAAAGYPMGLEGDEEPFEENEEKKEEPPKTPEQIRKELIAEGRGLGLRTKDFRSYGGFKVATDIAAGRRPARGATALTGSVGGLNAPSRQLMSERGRRNKAKRALLRDGFKGAAQQVALQAALLNEPTLKSAADVRAEQERKKRQAEVAARQARSAELQARIAELEEQKRLEKLEEEQGQ